ncbi:MAG: pseudouridine synthase [Candidatus Dormibacteria bacterium]
MSGPNAPPTERLNRFLARRGIASRRGADGVIAAGRVSVNGSPAAVGAVVDPRHDEVTVDGTRLPAAQAMVTLMVNKPAGVVSTRHDPRGRPTVMGLVEGIPGLVPVGRLDSDSRGLLLMTTDGELAHRVTHPRFGVTKRYLVEVAQHITPGHLLRLRRGVRLEDGPARALSARRVSARLIDLQMGEGRKREVRRLCAAVGLDVVDLSRIAIGPLELGELAEGTARPLRAEEMAALDAVLQPRPRR